MSDAAWPLRRAAAEDLDRLVGHVAEGMATYADFAPGWVPPPAAEHRVRTVGRMRDPGFRAALAAGDRASVAAFPVFAEEAGLAHLYGLWVPRELWGTGVARILLAWALDAMAAQDATAIRLVTPAAHARARAFYAREGFAAAAPSGFVPELGLELVELRRPLGYRDEQGG